MFYAGTDRSATPPDRELSQNPVGRLAVTSYTLFHRIHVLNQLDYFGRVTPLIIVP